MPIIKRTDLPAPAPDVEDLGFSIIKQKESAPGSIVYGDTEVTQTTEEITAQVGSEKYIDTFDIQYNIKVDTSELDTAIEKASKLRAILQETQSVRLTGKGIEFKAELDGKEIAKSVIREINNLTSDGGSPVILY